MLGKIKFLSSPVEIENSETRFGKGRSRATRKTPLDNGVLPVDSNLILRLTAAPLYVLILQLLCCGPYLLSMRSLNYAIWETKIQNLNRLKVLQVTPYNIKIENKMLKYKITLLNMRTPQMSFA